MSENDRLDPKPSVLKALFTNAGGRCSKCKDKITREARETEVTVVAAVAHINAVKPGEARYLEHLTAEQKRSYSNLLILCHTCHDEIDKDEVTYTAEVVRQIKHEHEQWVERQLAQRLPNITFDELAVVTKYLLSEPLYGVDYSLVPPGEKIRKNNLSTNVGNLITMGLIQSNLVKKYLNDSVTDDFSEKLRSGFVKKYLELREAGYKGDSLFYELYDFASGSSPDDNYRAAGLAVLTYFFEICEVFEK